MASSTNGEKQPEVGLTPEALAKIVSDAVAMAIATYEQKKNGPPGGGPAGWLLRRGPEELARLLGEMGVDEYELDHTPPASPATKP
jgi:hypothetical protein